MKKNPISHIMLCLGILLFVFPKAFAQQPDFMFTQSFPWERPYYGSYSLEVVSEDGVATECFFVAECYSGQVEGLPFYVSTQGLPSPAKVIKLSPTGEFIGELALGQEGVASSIDGLYCDPNHEDFYLALGRIEDEEHAYQKLFLAQFDKQLNLYWIREIDLQDDYKRYLLDVRSLMDSQGDLVLCTMPVDIDSYESNAIYQRLFIRLSASGDVLAISEFPEQTKYFEGSQGHLFEYQDGSGDYGQFSQTVVNNLEATLWRMNRDFEVVSQRSFPNRIETLHDILEFFDFNESGAVCLHDGSLLIGGFARFMDKDNFPFFHSQVSFMMKYNDNDSLVQLSYIRPENNMIKYPAYRDFMDDNGDDFFICDWQVPSPGYLDVPNTIVVTKTDNDANILWQRCFREDGLFFTPMSIMVTSDEGCLVSGAYWDVPDYTTEKVFVLKFFADGSLSVPEAEKFVRPYAFYPNPAKDQLHMQFSPDVQPKQIELYDLEGRLVRMQSDGFESVDVSQLPAGTYMMHVTLGNGKSYSDKVVKE